MLNYSDALDYVFSLGGGIFQPAKFGLEKIRKFLQDIGNPQNQLRFVHITGTKGKGSTAIFLSYILKSLYERVGVYTSPSLINVSERISINGELISPLDFAYYTEKIKVLYTHLPPSDIPTAFETFTIIAFLYFLDRHIDIAILEVGLGGRLDATNVIGNSAVSVITEISYDHQKILGETLSKIAYEKAGIIKPNTPVVVGDVSGEAFEPIEKVSKEVGAPLFVFSKDFGSINVKVYKDFSVFDFVSRVSGRRINGIRIKLRGLHQVINASVAIQTALLVDPNIGDDAIYKGTLNSFWPGRAELISRDPLILLDGAHNDASARALIEFVNLFGRDVVFLFSMLGDKNLSEVSKILSGTASRFIITEVPFSFSRRLNTFKIYEALLPFFNQDKIKIVKNPREAFYYGCNSLTSHEILCVTGSLYLAGFVRELNKIFTFSNGLI